MNASRVVLTFPEDSDPWSVAGLPARCKSGVGREGVISDELDQITLPGPWQVRWRAPRMTGEANHAIVAARTGPFPNCVRAPLFHETIGNFDGDCDALRPQDIRARDLTLRLGSSRQQPLSSEQAFRTALEQHSVRETNEDSAIEGDRARSHTVPRVCVNAELCSSISRVGNATDLNDGDDSPWALEWIEKVCGGRSRSLPRPRLRARACRFAWPPCSAERCPSRVPVGVEVRRSNPSAS